MVWVAFTITSYHGEIIYTNHTCARNVEERTTSVTIVTNTCTWGHVYISKRGLVGLFTYVCAGEYRARHLNICILHIIQRSSKTTYQRHWHSHRDCKYLCLVYSGKELLTGNTSLYFPNSYIITKRLHPKALNSYT